jgi:GxxExxY protein
MSLHRELTEKILEACGEVVEELGNGFLEPIYQKALLIALHQKGVAAKGQVPLKVKFRGYIVGEYFADIWVEEKIIVELKAVRSLTPDHVAQVINYLKATEVEVALLVNFGGPKLQVRWLHR